MTLGRWIGPAAAGFGKRVMFGSDQMVWPGTIERSIAIVEEAPFLSREQKRDILYENAARFLRLGEEERHRHRNEE
jgi:predicted TIM-barrel fold metal-dependent hydrolase